MVTGRTKGMTARVKGNVKLFAAQRDDGTGNPTEEYLLLRSDENGVLRVTGETVCTTAVGRSKGMTLRATDNVVLGATQHDDPGGTPTEEYLLLRADQNGLLRTTN